MTPEPDRRSFLSLAIFGIGAIFSAILGVPLIAYFVDPRNRKAPQSSFKVVENVKLNELDIDKPVQGVIRDTRVDGWTLYPNDVIGRVWVVKKNELPADVRGEDKISEFNAKPMVEKERFFFVFTTICPHLGCSVNLNTAGNGFGCPCHNATFALDGAKTTPEPAKRGMDSLAWQLDVIDPTRIQVEFKKFVASIEEKKSL